MAVQRAGEAGNPMTYQEARGVYAEDDSVNAGRDFAAKKAEEDAAKPDAATKRAAWAAGSKDADIKQGQTTQKVGTGITAAAGTVLTVGAAVAAFPNVFPVVGQLVSAAVLAVTMFVAACVAIVGGIVTAVGKGQVNRANNEKSAHLDDVNQGVNNAANAGEKAKMLNEKNRIAADRQKLGDASGNSGIRKDIKDQKEYMATLDPESKKYTQAQKKLDGMTKYEGQLEGNISEYEARAKPGAVAEGTQGALADAPPTGGDAPLALDANSAAEGVDGTGAGTGDSGVASNSSTTTTTTNTGTSAPAAAAPPPG